MTFLKNHYSDWNHYIDKLLLQEGARYSHFSYETTYQHYNMENCNFLNFIFLAQILLLFQISCLSYQEWIWWNQHHSTLPSWNVGLFCQMTKTAEWRFLSIYIPNSRSSFFKGAGTCRQFQQSWQRPTTSFAPVTMPSIPFCFCRYVPAIHG